ncbi:hypothetical protein F4775DRAFT_579039 [Biscogniauxia sp. FL1348]|nr:hypothetical protein F4775DRAFT_579039 [Biscogniauxia sp. FL1348]
MYFVFLFSRSLFFLSLPSPYCLFSKTPIRLRISYHIHRSATILILLSPFHHFSSFHLHFPSTPHSNTLVIRVGYLGYLPTPTPTPTHIKSYLRLSTATQREAQRLLTTF